MRNHGAIRNHSVKTYNQPHNTNNSLKTTPAQRRTSKICYSLYICTSIVDENLFVQPKNKKINTFLVE